MSEQQMNKNIEFIIEQQAKFAADIEILREMQAQNDRRLSNGILGLVDVVGSLTRAQIETDHSIQRLAEAQAGTEARLRETDERLRTTDDRLRILMNVVERHISGNGGPHDHAP
jgi:phage-related tail protein